MWRTRERKLILTFPKPQVQQGTVQLTDVVAGELYDLQTDPKEWQNLYAKDESRAAREQLSRELIAHLNEVALKIQVKPSK
jgi:hypothetical protein